MSGDPRNLSRRLARARVTLARLATLATLSASVPAARPAYSAQLGIVARVRFLELELAGARLPVHPSARTYRARTQTLL